MKKQNISAGFLNSLRIERPKTSLEAGTFKGELRRRVCWGDVVRKPVAHIFWEDKLLADYFRFHFQKFPSGLY